MKKKQNIILLTSRQNFVWTSMQEIIPMIESSWKKTAEINQHNLHIIDTDSEQVEAHLARFIQSDLIVVTCFNTTIARYITILREKMKIDSRIIFYLHGLATISLWPLKRFNVLDLFTANDIFVGTCKGDLQSLELSFTNITSSKIPFTIEDLPEFQNEARDQKPFTFIGRLSPQKNLHNLIHAYSTLPEEIQNAHPLFLYGTEDHLGFPNIGLKETEYKFKLQQLVQTYSLADKIIFKGFVERNSIQQELGRDFIFVSPSTHSDENFGMAAYRSLMAGAECILSDWGGHKEYKSHFPDHVQFVSTSLSEDGPAIDVEELKEKLLNSALKNKAPAKNADYFKMENICRMLQELIDLPSCSHIKIEPTTLALNIFHQQQVFEENKDIQRCFHSFKDPAFIAHYKAYAE